MLHWSDFDNTTYLNATKERSSETHKKTARIIAKRRATQEIGRGVATSRRIRRKKEIRRAPCQNLKGEKGWRRTSQDSSWKITT